MVDIDGSKDKYREDYNLRSGLRLLTFDVTATRRPRSRRASTAFRLEVDTPGDEPVSHFRLSAADQKLYDLRADFTRSKYFYQCRELFEAPVADDVRLDDLHDCDLHTHERQRRPRASPARPAHALLRLPALRAARRRDLDRAHPVGGHVHVPGPGRHDDARRAASAPSSPRSARTSSSSRSTGA
jgi:hypothetical protein